MVAAIIEKGGDYCIARKTGEPLCDLRPQLEHFPLVVVISSMPKVMSAFFGSKGLGKTPNQLQEPRDGAGPHPCAEPL